MSEHEEKAPPSLAVLALSALGVVYGDIGTSVLYTVRECFHPEHGVPPTHDNVLGILSLITWALALVVSFKYLTLVMRADNDGEGGILALMALVLKQSSGATAGPAATAPQATGRGLNLLILAGLFGASLLYGEGMITPAISVLGAIEGLEVATPVFKPWVVPITIVILLILFNMQKRGTLGIARIFGPATLLWFVSIAAAGIPWIVRQPEVLSALNPAYGIDFLAHHGKQGFLLLGSVVLCITGAEALTADMGHLGKHPIRVAWFSVVFPALLLNYYGQGAVLLSGHSEAVDHPFFALVSGVWIYPMIAIATIAAVVASQALITGAFSLTNQAVQLGYCPRLRIVHTSGHHEGQIYVPEVNTALMVACIGLVLAFKGSSALAAAYGIAVTGAMTVTSILFFAIMRERWGLFPALAMLIAFLFVDLGFFSANLVKLGHGGWLPLVAGAAMFTVFTTWKRGRRMLGDRLRASALPLEPFIADVASNSLTRVPGNAVFMSGNPDAVPPALLHHIKHNKSLHEQVLLLSIITEHVPGIRRSERVECKDLGAGLYHAVAHYGFMQTPRVPDILRTVRRQLEIDMELNNTSFYLGRETLISTGRSGMWRWRSSLFAFLSRNAHTATEFFGLPPGRVVELGMQVEL